RAEDGARCTGFRLPPQHRGNARLQQRLAHVACAEPYLGAGDPDQDVTSAFAIHPEDDVAGIAREESSMGPQRGPELVDLRTRDRAADQVEDLIGTSQSMVPDGATADRQRDLGPILPFPIA